jgi:hypothetical protein
LNLSIDGGLAVQGKLGLRKIQIIVQALAGPGVAGHSSGGSEFHLIFISALAASELAVDGETPSDRLGVEVATHSAEGGVGVAVGGDWGDTAGVTISLHHLIILLKFLFYL